MSELDQLDALIQDDSTGRLARAAQTTQRPMEAASAVANCLAHIDLPRAAPGAPLALILPPELRPIGDMVARLIHDPIRLEAARVTLGHTPVASLQAGGQTIALAQYLDAAHPAHILLVLLGLLTAARGNEHFHYTQSSNCVDALARCLPSISVAENPAKQLALRIHDRIPCFWGTDLEAAAARAWAAAHLWAAEGMALAVDQDELSRQMIMARFPRFWPNVAVFVRLATPDAPAELAGETSRILARRRFAAVDLHAPSGISRLDRALYWLEMGEWVALYAAALNNVDPAAQVPLDILFGRV